jgi:hypothetical protein
MMDNRRIRMIAELIKHLEGMDGEELKGKMTPVAIEVEAESPEMEQKVADGPMARLAADAGGGSPKPVEPGDMGDEDEMDDDEFAEMMKLNS